MRKLPAILMFLFLSIPFARAQSEYVTLTEEIKNSVHDTTKVNVYISLSKFYWNRNPDSSVIAADHALQLAKKIGFRKGVAVSYVTKGVALIGKGKYPEALKCQLEALKLSDSLKLPGLTGNCYNNIGIVYSNMGNHAKAAEYYEKSLEIMKVYGDGPMLSQLINIGDALVSDRQYSKALEYNSRALKIIGQIKDSTYKHIVLFNIGDIYQRMGEHKAALKYLQEALDISIRIRDIDGVSFAYNSMAKVFLDKHQFDKTIYYGKKSLGNLESGGTQDLLLDVYHILYTAYNEQKNFKQSLYYRNQEISLKEKMFSIEKEREANNLQAEYDLQKKQHEIELLTRDRELQQKEIVRATFKRKTYVIGLILFALISAYLIVSNKRKKKFNELLIERNNAIVLQKEKINEQNAHLERLNTVKNRLLSIISHDFRSPLNSLQSMVELMRDGTLTNQDIKQISLLMSEKLTVTVQLVENMLHWAKNQMDGMVLYSEHFDLKEVVEENVRLAKGQAETKQVTMFTKVTTPAMAFADKATVDIVIRNLMNNAIKFSRAGDQLSLSVVDQEKFVKVTVKDTGQGIPIDRQAKLFSGVTGFSTPGTSNEKGTGLGLTLCKELVEKNGGRIWVESEPGKGSSFMFTIPRDRVES
jgi:signal transduction histidine kinase/Tfp pilus assembly protein PilF